MFRAQLALPANIRPVLVQLQLRTLTTVLVMSSVASLQTCIITKKSATVHAQALHLCIQVIQRLALQAVLLQILIYWEVLVTPAAV